MNAVRVYEDFDINVTFSETSEHWAMPAMHSHNSYEIYILEKGSRTYIINDTLTELHAHDTVLIPPNELHSTAGGGYARYLITFRKAYLNRYFTKKAQSKLLACFEHKKIQMQNSDFDKLLRLTSKLAEDTGNFVLFAQILSLLYQNRNTEILPVSSKNKMLSDILEYIGCQYKSIAGLEEIAERFYISKHYLCRLFKAHTGISVMKYIHLLKIQNACDLLAKTNQSVSAVAEACGFHTSMYFCRTFKEIMGKTPTQYRKEL